MDVLPEGEGLAHGRIAGKMRQQAQLDLRIVRIDEHAARRGDERAAHLAAHLRAHGDILQVRLAGGDAPGGGDRLVKPGMDAPIAPGELEQAVDIGTVELGNLPVEQDFVDDGMQRRELGQRVRVSGIAAGGFLFGGQAEASIEHIAQLLRAVEVEGRAAAHFKDFRAQRLNLRMVGLAQAAQLVPVHQKAYALHRKERVQQRKLHIAVERCHALALQLRCIALPLLKQGGGIGGRLVAAFLRGEEIRDELRIVKGRGELLSPRREHRHQPLGIPEHERAGACEQRRKRKQRLLRVEPAAQQALRKGQRGAASILTGEGYAGIVHHQRDARALRQEGKPLFRLLHAEQGE